MTHKQPQRPLLLITRPAEEAARTSALAQARGFRTLVSPLLEVVPCPWDLPDGPFDALLFTSARAPALVATKAPQLRDLPTYAVGARTAEEAVRAGFRIAGQGEADGSAIVQSAARKGVRQLLHLGGEAKAALEDVPGLHVQHLAIYAAARVCELPADAREALATGLVFATLLFSARTARHFRALAVEAGIAIHKQRIVALSDAVARTAGPGWATVTVAASPSLEGALAAASALWQGSPHG